MMISIYIYMYICILYTLYIYIYYTYISTGSLLYARRPQPCQCNTTHRTVARSLSLVLIVLPTPKWRRQLRVVRALCALCDLLLGLARADARGGFG